MPDAQPAIALEHQPLAHIDDGVRAGSARPLDRQRLEIRPGNLCERRGRPELQLAVRPWQSRGRAAMAATTARQNSSSANASPITPTLACWRILATAEVDRLRTRSSSRSSQANASGKK